MVAAQKLLPSHARLKVVARQQKQSRVAGRKKAAMLPAAQAAELRIFARAWQDFLQDAIEELGLHPGCQRQQDEELRLIVGGKVADETAERGLIGFSGSFRSDLAC